MKKNIYAITCAVMLTISASAAEKPGIWDGIKEAVKGVVWMVRVEVCKIDMALFSKSGLVGREHSKTEASVETPAVYRCL